MSDATAVGGLVWREKKGQKVERYLELDGGILSLYKGEEKERPLSAVLCASIEHCAVGATPTSWSLTVDGASHAFEARGKPTATEWVEHVQRASAAARLGPREASAKASASTGTSTGASKFAQEKRAYRCVAAAIAVAEDATAAERAARAREASAAAENERTRRVSAIDAAEGAAIEEFLALLPEHSS